MTTDEILAEARVMIAADDARLSGMTCYDGMYHGHPFNRVRRLRDNRAALVAEIERLAREVDSLGAGQQLIMRSALSEIQGLQAANGYTIRISPCDDVPGDWFAESQMPDYAAQGSSFVDTLRRFADGWEATAAERTRRGLPTEEPV